MSNFSSLDLDRPIEKSSLIDTLRQPIWIALFTSVIIHAILGINLPKLSLFSEKAKLPPTIGLVELTPEQLELLPQPEEPEITFSTIPVPGNFSPITPSTPAQVPSFSQSPSSELPTIPVDPSDYNLPKLPPQDSSTSSSSFSTPSVSRLPRNTPPREFSYNYPSIPRRSLLPVTPVSPAPLPSRNRQPVDIFQIEPPQAPNQVEIDEYQIRKSLNLTDKVYESGLSRRPTLEIDPRDETAVAENSRKSYTANLKLPPQRYQDKVENKVAITPKENSTNTQPQKTPLPPDPTKKNRLSEAPIVRQLREGKTIQDIAQEAKQQEKIVVVAPSPTATQKSQPETSSEAQQQKIVVVAPSPTATQKSQPETPSVVAAPKPSPILEKPKEFKGSLLEKFQRPQQQKVTEVAPVAKPSPKPEENLAAATLEETKAPTPEVKVTPPVAPTPKPSPSLQPLREFKGSLLQELQEKKRANAPVNRESQSREIALGAVGAYTQWAIELEVGEESLTQPKAISNVYPEGACEQKLEGKATVGVLVNPDGSISKGPRLLLESGFPMLDEAALDAVSKESFDSNDDSKLYQYEFDFDSSSCS